VPHLEATVLLRADRLTLRRVVCDGADHPRQVDEGLDDERVILVLHGRFAYRDRATKTIASPYRALFLQGGQTHQIRHPHGEGDVCLALQGELCLALVAAGPTTRPVDPSSYVRVHRLAKMLEHATSANAPPRDSRGRAGERFEPPLVERERAHGVHLERAHLEDAAIASVRLESLRLDVEDTLCTALAPADRPTRASRRRDREIAERIAFALDAEFNARLSLTALANRAGVSVFHACHAFKRATGISIHRYQQEARLRHAQALILDTSMPLAHIAIAAGFANQGHFTNLFRERFGMTPHRFRVHAS
jgi:AraC-like DNA-binding protein